MHREWGRCGDWLNRFNKGMGACESYYWFQIPHLACIDIKPRTNLSSNIWGTLVCNCHFVY
jgi:hypothetical protein